MAKLLLLVEMHFITISIMANIQQCGGQDGLFSRRAVNRIRFGEVRTILELPDNIRHLEIDRYRTGYLLFSIPNALYTMNMQQSPLKPELIVGSNYSSGYLEGIGTSATFNGISSFIHMTKNLIMIIDSGNSVIRWLDRRNNRTKLLAGSSHQNFHVDGKLKRSRFVNPWNVEKLSLKYYITQKLNIPYLRVLHLRTSEVTSLYVEHTYLTGLQINDVNYHRPTKTFYFSSNVGIHTNPSFTGAESLIHKVPPGVLAEESKDGKLADALFAKPSQLEFITQNTLLVADDRLRVVDLKGGLVSSICKVTDNEEVAEEDLIQVNNTYDCITPQAESILRFNSTSILLTTGRRLRILALQSGNQSYPGNESKTVLTYIIVAAVLCAVLLIIVGVAIFLWRKNLTETQIHSELVMKAKAKELASKKFQAKVDRINHQLKHKQQEIIIAEKQLGQMEDILQQQKAETDDYETTGQLLLKQPDYMRPSTMWTSPYS